MIDYMQLLGQNAAPRKPVNPGTKARMARGATSRAKRDARILGVLDTELYSIKELAELTVATRAAVAADLRRLIETGAVRSRKIGTETYYWRPLR